MRSWSFPNEATVVRLVGAVLADLQTSGSPPTSRYLSEHSMAELYPEREDAIEITAELEPGD